MNKKFAQFLLLIIVFTIATARLDPTRPGPGPISPDGAPNTTRPRLRENPAQFPGRIPIPSPRLLLAGILSSAAAAVSSAGGIGGGGLFVPILATVAGLDLKSAAAYSAFMVTGGSIAAVGRQLRGSRPMIDYEIALLAEPCMLLGVSGGVVCNVVFPEWLITAIFAVFLAFCTFRTCGSGFVFWKLESERVGPCGSTEKPLLDGGEVEGKMGIPWVKLGMLVLIWLSFFVLYLLRGNRYGQGIIQIETCGTGYWIISSAQIPLAIFFTIWMLHSRIRTKVITSETYRQVNVDEPAHCRSPVFPLMALLAGILGGIFGIGGGMLISPLLLQMGIEPEVTASTCSFMVLFSSSMSATQYLLLGMEDISGPLAFAAICFVASWAGLTLVQRAILRHGRASLIVFSVGTVMALSTIFMTGFGAVDVWRDYMSGKSMGFKKPC